jgi:hypothetical protein
MFLQAFSINSNQTFRPVPEAVMRALAGESVILHLGSGQYFSLDAVGTRIWQLLEAGRSRDDMLAALLDEYSVTREELEQDIDTFVQTLLDNGLVEKV